MTRHASSSSLFTKHVFEYNDTEHKVDMKKRKFEGKKDKDEGGEISPSSSSSSTSRLHGLIASARDRVDLFKSFIVENPLWQQQQQNSTSSPWSSFSHIIRHSKNEVLARVSQMCNTEEEEGGGCCMLPTVSLTPFPLKALFDLKASRSSSNEAAQEEERFFHPSSSSSSSSSLPIVGQWEKSLRLFEDSSDEEFPIEKRFASRLYASSWLLLPLPLFVALYLCLWDIAAVSFVVVLTSVNYWRNPRRCWRRNVDMTCVFSAVLYHSLQAWLAVDFLPYGLGWTVFCFSGVFSYFVGRVYGRRGEHDMGTKFHLLLHVLGVIANIILYFGLCGTRNLWDEVRTRNLAIVTRMRDNARHGRGMDSAMLAFA